MTTRPDSAPYGRGIYRDAIKDIGRDIMENAKRYQMILTRIAYKWVGYGQIPEHINPRQLAIDALSLLYIGLPETYRNSWADISSDYNPKDPEVGLKRLGLILKRQLRIETRSIAPKVGEIFPNMGNKPVVSVPLETSGLFHDVARLKHAGHSMAEIADILGLKSGWVRHLREDIKRLNPELRLPKKSSNQLRQKRYRDKKRAKNVELETLAHTPTLAHGAWV